MRTAAQWLAEKPALSKLCDEGLTVTEMARRYGEKVATMAAVLNALQLTTSQFKLRDEIASLARQQEKR